MSVSFDRLRQIDHAAGRGHAAARRGRERLLHLAAHLPPADRWLVEQVYGQGLPLADLARAEAGGTPDRQRQRQRRLSRRLAGLVRRMRDPAFQLVATRPELLPREARAAARHVILHGQSLRDTARLTQRSLHQVRRHVRTARDLARIL